MSSFGTAKEYLYVMFGLELRDFVFYAILLLRSINLISNQYDLYSLLTILFYLLKPEILNTFKCFIVMYVKCNYYSLCTFVVGTRYCSESLLSCCVPNLKLYKGFIYLKCSK